MANNPLKYHLHTFSGGEGGRRRVCVHVCACYIVSAKKSVSHPLLVESFWFSAQHRLLKVHG